MIEQYKIILNPQAGKGSAFHKKSLIEEYLVEKKVNFGIICTEKPGHAINLACELATEKNTVVVAAGGDGTVNEVINGLMRYKETCTSFHTPVLGVIPLGRGNDFTYGTGIPVDIMASLENICSGNCLPMDVGLLKGGNYPDGRYFGNGIGAGFDTRVGFEAAKWKYIRSGLAYAIAAMKLIIVSPKVAKVSVEADDYYGIHTPVMISILNGNRMGGSFLIAPRAENNDGFFDLCMTEQLPRGRMLKAMSLYMKGEQESMEETVIIQARRFKLKALEGSLPVHADGETICYEGEEIEVECLPRALDILKL